MLRPVFNQREHTITPGKISILGFAASIPWCCVVPALLAFLGLGTLAAGRWFGMAIPLFLGLGGALFVHAHYLLWIKRHGSPAARRVTIVLTLLAAALWAIRLS